MAWASKISHGRVHLSTFENEASNQNTDLTDFSEVFLYVWTQVAELSEEITSLALGFFWSFGNKKD